MMKKKNAYAFNHIKKKETKISQKSNALTGIKSSKDGDMCLNLQMDYDNDSYTNRTFLA